MAIVGGETRTVIGRMTELTAWWPMMLALLIGGTLSAYIQWTGAELPNPAQNLLDLYRGARDNLMTAATGGEVNPKMADLAIVLIPLVTMLSRRAIGFAFSVGLFLALAAAAWFMLKHFGHASA